MHRLLERQLRRAVAADGSLDLDRLYGLVSAAYAEADLERRMTDRSLQVLQEELQAAHRQVREEAESRFAALMDNIGEAAIVIDQHGVVEGFNRAAARTFGYEAAEVIGRNVTMLMTATDAAHHDETLRRYRETGERRVIGKGREVVARRADGTELTVELAVGEANTGQCRRFVGVIRDISERKRAESELRKSEEWFRDLAGSASDWFWETDEDYRLRFISDRIAGVLGVKPSAILGSSFFDIGLGDDPAAAAEHRAILAEQKSFRDVVFHVGPPEGKDSRVIRISGRPYFNPAGQFTGYRGIGVDITRETQAERRAKLAQQQLSDAIEGIVDAIAVYDAEDRLVVANKNYLQLFTGISTPPGTPFEDILGRLVELGVFNTEGRSPEGWLQERMARHREASGEPFVFRMANGRWILSREYRTRDGGVVGVRTDISELKRNEAELDALRRRYQVILDSAGEGILGLDGNGRIIFANRTACDLLRVKATYLIGVSFHLSVQPFSWDGAPYPLELSAIRRAYREGAAEQIRDDVFWSFDGTALHVDYLVAPILEAGEVNGAVVVFRDAGLRLRYEQTLADQQRELERLVAERTRELQREVEVRARTEEALRGSRERLKAIADNLVEGVLVIDRGGHLIFANASARGMLGLDPATGDIEGHPLDGLLLLRQADGFADFAHAPWREAVTDGGTWRDDDAVFATPAGLSLPVAYACAPLREGDGVRGAIISFRDIRSLKEAQREALQSSRLASVGQLAAGIAHEINTPVQYVGDNLHFIQGAVTKLAAVVDAARVGGPAEVEAAAAKVKLPYLLRELPVAVTESLDGVAQIGRIVLSMKEFSHPGTSTKALADLNQAIENTLTVSRNAWKHVAELDKDLAPDLPPVLCFLGELNQVFLNLVVNAAHAIEASGKPLPGRLSIRTARVGDEVEIRVEDNGTGIPDAIRDRIFDPFFTTKEVGKGTGQGLAICRDVVVTKHGGRIIVDGRPGEGATFTLRLPVGGERDDGGTGE